VPCGGHTGVKQAISVIEKWEKANGATLSVLGFMDRDYGARNSYRRITVSNNRDVEIDMFMTGAGVRLLKEKASRKKCPSPRSAIAAAMKELRVVGLIRKYNSDNACSWAINSISLERCVDPSGSLSAKKVILLLQQANSINKEECERLANFLESNPNVRTEAVLRGHDVSKLLGKWLRKKIGNRTKQETNWNAIEENLRLATDHNELMRYNWARRIWSHLTKRA
jgi:hypothetical protein